MRYLAKLCILLSSVIASTVLATSSFFIEFNDGTLSRADFKALENAVLTSNVSLESSTDDKTITYTIPKQLKVTPPDGANVTTDSNDNTIVTLTYDKNDNTVTSTAVILSLDASKMYSKANYQITVNFDDGTGATPVTQTANITVFDYAGQSSNFVQYYSIVPETNPLFYDKELLFKFQAVNRGDYNRVSALFRGGYRTVLKNPTLDLSQLKVDTGGTGNNFTPVDISAITVNTNNGAIQSYDPTTGVITFNDTSKFYDTVTLPVKLTFAESQFPEGSLIRFDPNIMFSYTACENDSDCLGGDPDAKISVDNNRGPYTYKVLNKTEHYLNLAILQTASYNRVLTNTDNQPLFQLYGQNYLEKLDNISFKVNIPKGMLIQQVFAGSGKYGSVTIDDGTNPSQTFSPSNGEYFNAAIDLDHPINGDSISDITVTLAGYDEAAVDTASSLYYPYKLIKFLGRMDSAVYNNDGDPFTVSIDSNSIDAYITDNGGTLKAVAITDPTTSNNSLTRTVYQLQRPSPYLSSRFEDKDNNKISNINVDLDDNTVVKIQTKIGINSYAYGSDYHQLDQPVIYFDVPPELVAESGDFGISDVELLDSNNTPIAIDSVNVVTGSNVFTDGQIVEVKTSGYDLIYPDTLTARLKTIVPPTITETATIDKISGYPVAIGSLNKQTTLSLHGGVSNLYTSSDIAGNLIGATLDALSIIVPKEISAKLLVNTDTATSDNDYEAVYATTDRVEYPKYYLGSNGAYRVILNNLTATDYNNFFAIVTLPNLAVDQIIQASDDSANDSSAPVAIVSYSADGTTFGALPTDGKVTAIKYEFTSFAAGKSYQANIPFTINGLTTEDNTIYGDTAAAKGETLFNFNGGDHNGTTTGMQIIKSDPPVITLNNIVDNKEYDYTNITDFKTDITSPTATDDPGSKSIDIITSDPALVSFTEDAESTGSLSATMLSLDTLETAATSYNDNTYDAGDFVITYKTDKDADAQQTEKQINIKVYPKPYLSSPTTSPVTIEYGATMSIDDLVTQSGIKTKGNDSGHYTLATTSPNTINTKDSSQSNIPVAVNLDDTGNSKTAIDDQTVDYIVTLPTLTVNDTINVTQNNPLTQAELEAKIGAVITGDVSGDVTASVTDSSLVDFSTVGCYPVTVTMTDSATLIDLDTQNPQVCVEELVLGVTPTNTTPIPSTSFYSLLMLITSILGLTLYYRRRS